MPASPALTTVLPPLSSGDYLSAVEHFARGLPMAGEKAAAAVLRALEQSLPAEHFAALLRKLGA